MKKILILANSDGGLYNFRRELLERLISEGFEVIVSVPKGKRVIDIESIGCEVVDAPINRRGLNLIEEIKLYKYYLNLIKSISPNVILTYTIKPNIYGGIAARKLSIPYIPNITGLGSALVNPRKLQKLLFHLYKKTISKSQVVFFQNESNKEFFLNNNILIDNYEILPGSGVNLEYFQYLEYPNDSEVNFVFISRIMKEKGINEYLKAADYIKKKYPKVNFHICGTYEENYEELINNKHNDGTIVFHGKVDDVRKVLNKVHCIIHPSYHEGMSNVLLEAASSGRPIIASDIPGCRETFDEEISGFSFQKKDTEGLIQAIEKFIQLDNNTRKQMGLSGRKKMEKEFDRQIVVEKYLKEIESI